MSGVFWIMKILCLGDSFTDHWQDYEESIGWVQQLARCMPEHEFYNWAVSGTGINLHDTLFKKLSLEVKPDLVIWQLTHPARHTFFTNEFSNTDILKAELKHKMEYNLTVRERFHYDKLFPSTLVIGGGCTHPESHNKFNLTEKIQFILNDKKAHLEYAQTTIDYYKYTTDNIIFFGIDSLYSDFNNIHNFKLDIDKSEFNSKQLKKYVTSTNHFNTDTNAVLADFIKGLLNEKIT